MTTPMTTFATGSPGSPSGRDGLTRDALTVLQPGFTGTTAPDWLLRRLGEGLASVGLFGRNITSPGQLAALTARLRAEHEDVLVAIDEEGGDVTRLEVRTGSSFPGNHALGAVDDVDLTRAVAFALGRRLAECGVNLNWAPSADVNANPSNPVIGVRSFGADPGLVARHTAAYVTGLQAAGVAACTKHFPGHGDTAVDSHLSLPRIDADRSLVDSRDLAPFRAAIAAGSRAIMSAHILVPALDPDLPATLSHGILTDLLRGELGYDGLIVTDGMEMRAIAGTYGIEHGSVLALAAGADAICVGGGLADEETVRRLRDALVTAVRDGDLPEERLADAANRVRALAKWTRSAAGERATATGGGPKPSGRPTAPAGASASWPPAAPSRRPSRSPTSRPPSLSTSRPSPRWRTSPWATRPLGRRCGAGPPPPRHGHRHLHGRQRRSLRPGGRRHPPHRRRRPRRTPPPLDDHRPRHPPHRAPRHDRRGDGHPQSPPRGALHIATHGAARVCGRAAAEVIAGAR